MSEEEVQGEMPAETEAEQVEAPEVEAEEFDQERAMATIRKLREFEKTAKAQEKELEKLRQAEEERRLAEMSEIEKLQATNEKLKSQLDQVQTENLQRQIAAEMGLPEALALRIAGEDAEAMRADAKTLLEAMPAKTKPKVGATNPGVGSEAGESDEQRRKRLLG